MVRDERHLALTQRFVSQSRRSHSQEDDEELAVGLTSEGKCGD